MEPNIAPTRWCPCWCRKCVSGQRKPDKISAFSDAYKSCTWCLNAVQRKLKEIGYTSLFLHCVGEYSCIVTWKDPMICGAGFGLKFSRTAFY